MEISKKKFLKYRKRLFRELLLRVAIYLYDRNSIRKIVNLFFRAKHPKKWVFIVGCYNSGTTLLQRIVSHHPDISTLPREGVRLTSYLSRPEWFGWERMWCKCKEQVFFARKKEPQTVEKILVDWAPFFRSQCDIFLEKSIANITRIEWLEENLENTYFIGIVRNPYAVSAGIRKRVLLQGKKRKEYGTHYPIEFTAQQWLDSNNIILQAHKKVKNFHCVRYEELVATPVNHLNEIFSFVGLNQPYTSFKKEEFQIASHREKMINKNSENISLLQAAEKEIVWNIVAETATKLGYKKF